MEHLIEKLEKKTKMLHELVERISGGDFSAYGEEGMYNAYLSIIRRAEEVAVAARLLPTGYREMDAEPYLMTAEAEPIFFESVGDGIEKITLERLLPLRRNQESALKHYFSKFELPLMERYRDHMVERKEEMVFVYVYYYENENRLRDYDNVETKLLTDMVAPYFLSDDSPRFLSKYSMCKKGAPKTELYIMKKKQFLPFMEKMEGSNGQIFKAGSISEKILKLVYYNGELPYQALRIIGTSTTQSQRCVKRLIEKEYLKTEYPLKWKRTILLGTKNIDGDIFPGARKRYVEKKPILYRHGTGAKQTRQRRKRNLNLSLSSAFLTEVGISVFPGEKPVFGEEIITRECVCAYQPDEIKKCMNNAEARASATSAMGVLTIQHELSYVFCLDEQEKNSHAKLEQGAIRRIENMFDLYSDFRDRNNRKNQIERSWLLSMKKEYLAPLVRLGKEKKPFDINTLSTSIKAFYFIPVNRDGVRIMRMALTEEKRERLYRVRLGRAERERRKGAAVDCDGMQGEKIILVYMVPDVTKLQRFFTHLYLQEKRGALCEHMIYCYDCQLEELLCAKEQMGIKELQYAAFSIDDIERIVEGEAGRC